jgi:hypothetical protein
MPARKKTILTTPTAMVGAQVMTEGSVRDLIKEELRAALRSQARELETHLNSIHERLVALERR